MADNDSFDTSHPAALAHHSAIRSIQRVVAETAPLQDANIASAGILRLLRETRPLVLTGAGVSTDSGIPDYRGPNGSLVRHRPMTYQEFRHDPKARHRYWARSFVGWRHMDRARPNRAHEILASWAASGLIAGLVTQNVDGLHAEAGAADVVTLHGDLDIVRCLDCGATEARASLDARLAAANPGYLDAVRVAPELVNPDGDVTLDQAWVERFVMAPCLVCGSLALKPDVVYFGENVPEVKKSRARELAAAAGSVLTVGTSLAVTSGYRFVLDAKAAGKPVGIINGGPTRGDAKADYRWRSDVASALAWLDARVRGSASR